MRRGKEEHGWSRVAASYQNVCTSPVNPRLMSRPLCSRVSGRMWPEYVFLVIIKETPVFARLALIVRVFVCC